MSGRKDPVELVYLSDPDPVAERAARLPQQER